MYKSKEDFGDTLIGQFVFAIILVVMIVILAYGFMYAFDKHFENQDTMLCESAKVSGNIEYLKKCEVYYETGNIKDIKK